MAVTEHKPSNSGGTTPQGEAKTNQLSNKGPRLGNRWTNSFKGATPDMDGKVFQIQSEYAKKGQFEDTLEALQRYVGRFFPDGLSSPITSLQEIRSAKIK